MPQKSILTDMPLDPRNRQLLAMEKILQISRDMFATADLDELLNIIIARSMELLEAERATLFLYDSARNEMVSRIAAGAKEIRVPATAGIVGAAAASQTSLCIPDAYADPRFNREVDRQTGFVTRNLLAIPLRDYRGELVGVLEVLNKRGGAFSPDDMKLAETLAAQAGVVLQRARLLEHYIQKQRMEQSLAIARQIQQDLLPRQNPQADGFDIAGWSGPADETGGDIYDFFHLGAGRWTLMLADATGHGVGPALVIAEARAMLRALSADAAAPTQHCLDCHRRATDPACTPGIVNIPALMSKVNNLLVHDLSESRFVTCFFGLLDAAAGTVRYASAGQGPIICYNRSADKFDESSATALPLGVMDGLDFHEQVEHRLGVGDMLAVVTDGFFEAANAADEQFGTGRMCDILRACRDLPSEQIIARLRAAVDKFTAGAPQADDLTAIIVRRVAQA